MSHPSSKNTAIRQFKNLDINDIPNENNGIEESTSSCTLPLAFQVDEMNKDQSDCGGRSIMGGKRGPYLCRDCTSIKVPVPLKGHTCPYRKKFRYVKRDATEKREVEIQTEEPSFLQQMRNESRKKEPKE